MVLTRGCLVERSCHMENGRGLPRGRGRHVAHLDLVPEALTDGAVASILERIDARGERHLPRHLPNKETVSM